VAEHTNAASRGHWEAITAGGDQTGKNRGALGRHRSVELIHNSNSAVGANAMMCGPEALHMGLDRSIEAAL